jgi:flagellar hook-associated protein 3
MNLRVSAQTILSTALAYSSQQSAALAKLQEEASSGNSILTPDDNPIGEVSVINNGYQVAQLGTDLTNIQAAQADLNTSATTLQAADNLIVQAKDLALQGANDTNDQNGRSALATQVNALLSQLVTLANTQNNGQYVFAGTKTGTVPFVTDSSGKVSYQGSEQAGSLLVGATQTVAVAYPGSQVFQYQQRGTSVYTGTTGAAPGTGTDSATGEGTLVVSHTSTTYGLGQGGTSSGVVAGTGSAAGDTIIGPAGAHTLTVVDTSGTGAGGTVSLDGGPPVAFTSSDTNLKVTNASGDVVYLNTQNVTQGFNGTVPITADGTIAASGGTAVPITFSSNQQVTDTAGGVTNVNTTNVIRTGTTYVSYTGTYDAFQALAALRDDLNNTRGLSPTDQAQAISQRASDLDQVSHHLLQVVGQQSADLQNLGALQTQTQNVQLQAQQTVGNLQSADMAGVVVNLQAQQNLLQLTLASTARLYDQSLLNFLH